MCETREGVGAPKVSEETDGSNGAEATEIAETAKLAEVEEVAKSADAAEVEKVTETAESIETTAPTKETRKSRTTRRAGEVSDFRRTSGRIGMAMLLFLILFYGLDVVALLLLAAVPMGEVGEKLIDSATYFLSFALPAIFLWLITPRRERSPMPLSPQLPPRLWLLIPAGLAVILSSAIVNSQVLAWIGYPSSSGASHYGMTATQGVLLFISTAVVPALCEELLFRGAIFSALLPYGKTTAVLVSAVLFGLMHQNIAQIFYTTMAGVVLGVLCARSGSIWAGVLLHFFNNFIAVIEDILMARLPSLTALRLCAILEVAVIGVGLLALAVLLGKPETVRLTDGFDEAPAKGGVGVRAFCSPAMVVFVVLALGQIIYFTVIYAWR